MQFSNKRYDYTGVLIISHHPGISTCAIQELNEVTSVRKSHICNVITVSIIHSITLHNKFQHIQNNIKKKTLKNTQQMDQE